MAFRLVRRFSIVRTIRHARASRRGAGPATLREVHRGRARPARTLRRLAQEWESLFGAIEIPARQGLHTKRRACEWSGGLWRFPGRIRLFQRPAHSFYA